MDKKAFNFYKSYYDLYQELNEKQKIKFMDELLSVQFFIKHIDSVIFEDQLLKVVWASIKHSITAQISGYCSKNKIFYDDIFYPCKGGRQGGRQGGTAGACLQGEGQVQEKGEGKGEVEQTVTASLRSAKNTPSVVKLFMDEHNYFDNSDLDGSVIHDIMDRFASYRNKIKKPIKTVAALNGFFKSLMEIRDAGYNPDEAFETMQEHEWLTVKLDYINKGKK
jgi:hypothetical protein